MSGRSNFRLLQIVQPALKTSITAGAWGEQKVNEMWHRRGAQFPLCPPHADNLKMLCRDPAGTLQLETKCGRGQSGAAKSRSF